MGDIELSKTFQHVYCKGKGANTAVDEYWMDELLSFYLDR